MALTLSEIRERITDHLTARLGPDGWQAVPVAFDNFPDELTQHQEALGFTVGVLSSSPIAQDPRQRASRGVVVATVVGVRYASIVRADYQLQDYDRALDAEQALVAAMLATPKDYEMHVRFRESTQRTITGDGSVFVGDVRFEVLHTYGLL